MTDTPSTGYSPVAGDGLNEGGTCYLLESYESFHSPAFDRTSIGMRFLETLHLSMGLVK